VAQILGSTVGTVKANLFHALGNLRRLVAEEGGAR
jgi:DNA-directed RNA polymerase specialized sigma24 family protein